ncbi:unnamed protein product [marine sediment metagenome]|uniref:Uncharacterized protein n=1 Tax=marine sediment metagenome TaxID=412755 RepID=X0U4E8_9ZZZZ
MVKQVIQRWVAFRYGGLSEHLKPPLGFIRWSKPSLAKRAVYTVRYTVWQLEEWVYQRYGGGGCRG